MADSPQADQPRAASGCATHPAALCLARDGVDGGLARPIGDRKHQRTPAVSCACFTPSYFALDLPHSRLAVRREVEMRIVCQRCGCPIDLPDRTPGGAPVVCPRCGNAGSYTAPVPVASPTRGSARRSSAHFVVLALLVAFCVGAILAVSQPWPSLVLSVLGIAGGVVLITGKVGRTWKSRWPLAIGSVLISSVLAFVAVATIGARRQEEQRRAEAAEAARQAEERRVDELRAQAADRIARARQHLAQGEQAVADLDPTPMAAAAREIAPLADLDPRPEGYSEVENGIRALNARLNRRGAEQHLDQATAHADARRWSEVRQALAAASPYLAALGEDNDGLRQRQAALQERGAPWWAAQAGIDQANAAVSARHADAIAAEAAYDAALSALDAIEGESLAANRQQVRSLRGRLQQARNRNHRAAERLRQQQAARAAQLARCGPRPMLSPWDGELIGSESFVRRAAHDPSSIDVENCTLPSLAVDTNHCWVSSCDVLGRNMFGAMIRRRMQFEVRGGQVVSAR